MFTKIWWKAAGIRAIRTVAQTALGMIAVGAAMSDVDWLRVLSCAAVAGILSMLTSLAGLPEIQTVNDDKGRITVKAYDKYDEDGSPILDDGACAACDLTPYLMDDAENGGDGNADR